VRSLFALAGLLLLATGCGASQRSLIAAAVRSERPAARVSQIRIAHSDPRYATARAGSAFVFLDRSDRWRVVEIGADVQYPSCVQTPRAVVRELFGGWCFGARGALTRLR